MTNSVFMPQLLKGRHMMVRVGGGWDTLEHFLSRHEPCQVRLVTQGRRDVLPLPPSPPAPEPSPGAASPVDSKASSVSGKTSPVDPKLGRPRSSSKPSSGKTSPLEPRRTSTPNKPAPVRNRSALTLPLKDAAAEKSPAPRARKQSAPSSFSTPGTPTGRSVRTPPVELRKSLTSNALVNTPKKSRSMSLANAHRDDRKSFCGTDKLNQAKRNGSASGASTPTEPLGTRKTRSQSLASTPVNEPKKTLTNGYTKKTRSMSLAGPVDFSKPLNKSSSVSTNGSLTQAAIEESIRISLEASIADNTSPKKPFLHIKAKYRSPPPREIPPR